VLSNTDNTGGDVGVLMVANDFGVGRREKERIADTW
jgi:hypothetical protein